MRAIRRYLAAEGFDKEAQSVATAILIRESSGDRCAVHVLGHREFGLGAAGLFVKFHLRKWDSDADPRALHQVDATAHVLAVIFRNAKYRYGAESWARLNQLYGGRFRPEEQVPKKDLDWERRLRARGIEASNPISKVK